MLLAIVFGAIFLTVLGALASFSITQNKFQVADTGKAKALALAEAGIEYYKWHFAHFPTDLTNGTGNSTFTLPQSDPEGGNAGTVTMTITPNQSCGQTQSIDISSKGTVADGSNESQTVVARYAQPTVAGYSYIVNDSVWAGSDRTINGPFHSNGGVRMDGTANAPVTSSLSSWQCTSDFGCSTTQTEPGVFGAGPNQTLWTYPTPQVDFSGIAANFTNLKSIAQSGGLYFPRYSGGNSNSEAYWKGYHLIFNSDGTVTVKRVTSASKVTVQPLNPADSTTDHTVINNETTLGTYAIPSSCGLIFVEDNTWIEGTLSQKATVVVANVSDTGVAPNAMLRNNITYANATSGLTVLAANDILISGDSPSNMTLNGIFVAEGGAFGRNYYGCPSSYEPRGTLTIHGTTVSNKRTGTKWAGGCPNGDAGYQLRTDTYDRSLASDPPPFTPSISTDYQFIDWKQK